MATLENFFASEICPYCDFRREIVTIKFRLFRPAIALFVCPSCGSAAAEPNGSTKKKPGRLRLRSISLPVPQAQPEALITDSVSEAIIDSVQRQSHA
jgi:hypothetical protein